MEAEVFEVTAILLFIAGPLAILANTMPLLERIDDAIGDLLAVEREMERADETPDASCSVAVAAPSSVSRSTACALRIPVPTAASRSVRWIWRFRRARRCSSSAATAAESPRC
jgi:hypothetical protein